MRGGGGGGGCFACPDSFSFSCDFFYFLLFTQNKRGPSPRSATGTGRLGIWGGRGVRVERNHLECNTQTTMSTPVDTRWNLTLLGWAARTPGA